MQKYANAMDALEGHIESNKPVFDAHKELAMKVMDAENELRDAVAENGSGIVGAGYTATYTPVEQKVYDEEKIKKLCPEAITVNQRPARITIGKTKSGV